MNRDKDKKGSHSGDRRPKKAPTLAPADLAEQKVAETLRVRRSKCSAGNCSSDGGCATGGCGVGSLVDQIANAFDYTDTRSIVEIEFKGFRRDHAVVGAESGKLKVGTRVIVEQEGAIHWALVSMVGSLVHAKRKAKRLSGEKLPRILRQADESDLKKIEQCAASEKQAYSVCKTRIESFRLPMDLVEAEWQYDHRKLTFFFTADGRVDFRELVRDLAAIFNTRIELRQIPVRDAAKRLGGLGICGRELCCTTHLGQYEHITLDHAKIQQIPSNPSKLSGQCGRLKCCLLYEIDTYIEGLKRFPPMESTFRTSIGTGIVSKIDLFKEKVYLYHRETSEWEVLELEEVQRLQREGPQIVVNEGADSEAQKSDASKARQRPKRSKGGSKNRKGSAPRNRGNKNDGNQRGTPAGDS